MLLGLSQQQNKLVEWTTLLQFSAFVEGGRVKKDAFQTFRPEVPSLARPDSLQMSGANPKWNTTGGTAKGLENLVTASMPYCPWRHKAVLLHGFQNYTCTLYWCLLRERENDPALYVDRTGSGRLTFWNNKMKQRSMKKPCGPVEGLYAPTNLIRFIAWFMGHDVILKDLHYFIISNLFFLFYYVFFFSNLKGWCSFRHIDIFSFLHKLFFVGGFSAMSFFLYIRSIWATLLNLSMITFLWRCCIIVIFFYLPFVSIWFEKLHITHHIQPPTPTPPPFFQICNVPLSCVL